MRVETLDCGVSGIVRLRTDGGSRFIFRLEYFGFPQSSLPYPGESLDEPCLAALEAASEVYGAEAKAMELLSRAEHTRYLLTQKLRKRGIPDERIAPALDRLESRGLLDNERYARSWTEDRLRRKGEGPARLFAGLIARGVQDAIAKRVIGEVLDSETREEALIRSGSRLLRSYKGDSERVRGRLRSEGWKPSEISEALKALQIEGE